MGSLVEHYYALNPLRKPTVLFAPGVPESRWIAEYLSRPHSLNGLRYEPISTAHIDAETTESERTEIFEQFRTGEIQILSNYGILQEGWDAPFAEHAILCRPVASVTTYVQMVGRILRAAEGKTRATLQDHVGAWWRHGLGSPNIDRIWRLEDTNRSISKADKQTRETREAGEEKDPGRCPKCNRVLAVKTHGFVCLCGHVFKRSTRTIIQVNGTLKRQQGSPTKRKPPKTDTDYFRSALYGAVRSGQTVGQAYFNACRRKREATGNPDATILRRNCDIAIPFQEDNAWRQKVATIYPGLFKQKKAKK